jgi:hypothetical protein
MTVPNYAVRTFIFGLLEAFFVFLLVYFFQTQTFDIGLEFSVVIFNLWSLLLVVLGFALIITVVYGTVGNKMEKTSRVGLLMGFYGVVSLFLSSGILLGIFPVSTEITRISIIVFVGGVALILNQFAFSHLLEEIN